MVIRICLYAGEGRPSIPPEQLLKARALTALDSVRSEAQQWLAEFAARVAEEKQNAPAAGK